MDADESRRPPPARSGPEGGGRAPAGRHAPSGTSLAMATTAGIAGREQGMAERRAVHLDLGVGAGRLKPSTIRRSTGLMRAISSSSVGSCRPRSSWTRAQRAAEETTDSTAPAARWRWLSLPGRSTSKPSWACLTVETVKPRPVSTGSSRVTSVVFPLPFPARNPDDPLRRAHAANVRRRRGGGKRGSRPPRRRCACIRY